MRASAIALILVSPGERRRGREGGREGEGTREGGWREREGGGRERERQ